jgi:3'-phosphoadenosine 5'-phosphosulfate (PAPS) 3'-phosphatase
LPIGSTRPPENRENGATKSGDGEQHVMAYERELEVAVAAARGAAGAIMAIFRTAAVRAKADGSFVTEADEESDRIIRAAVAADFPADAILTEEGIDDHARLAAARCWIVDPIDGTAAFVAKLDDFDVYIALIEAGRPVIAATLQPATGLLLTATAGGGAQIARSGHAPEPLRYPPAGGAPRLGTRPWLGSPANRPQLDEIARRVGPEASVIVPETGLNVRSFLPPVPLAEAIVGLPAPGQSLDAWEWDVAAVDLIVREAGGAASDLAGNPLIFNQPLPRLGAGLLLCSYPRLHDRILAALPESDRK